MQLLCWNKNEINNLIKPTLSSYQQSFGRTGGQQYSTLQEVITFAHHIYIHILCELKKENDLIDLETYIDIAIKNKVSKFSAMHLYQAIEKKMIWIFFVQNKIAALSDIWHQKNQLLPKASTCAVTTSADLYT